MLSYPASNIQILITNLMIDDRYKAAIENAGDLYQIKQFKIESLTPNEVFMMHYNITSRYIYQNISGSTAQDFKQTLIHGVKMNSGYLFGW